MAASKIDINCTEAAVIRLIRGEGFYSEFEEIYRDKITIEGQMSKTIKNNSTAFHINARFYGVEPRCHTLNISAVSFLTAVLLGYVRSYCISISCISFKIIDRFPV